MWKTLTSVDASWTWLQYKVVVTCLYATGVRTIRVRSSDTGRGHINVCRMCAHARPSEFRPFADRRMLCDVQGVQVEEAGVVSGLAWAGLDASNPCFQTHMMHGTTFSNCLARC